ncbi:MAG: MFS transporter [Bacillota bacterium]
MKTYKATTLGAFSGIFMQAIVCNLTPVIFICIMDIYGLTYVDLGTLVMVNFLMQMTADISFSGVIDKVGYKKMIFPAISLTAVGLLVFGLSPYLFDNILVGLYIGTGIFAFSSGLLEITLSPLIAVINQENKSSAMGLLHSFFCWGTVAVVLVTTLMIAVFGGAYWNFIAMFWIVAPIISLCFFAKAKFPNVSKEREKEGFSKKVLLSPYVIVALLGMFFGAGGEIAISQFSSSFLESGMGLNKTTGDILGVAGFAVCMGVGRIIIGKAGDKIDLSNAMIAMSALAFVTYVMAGLAKSTVMVVAFCALTGLAVSCLWPGIMTLVSIKHAKCGAWLMAMCAVFGDFGASVAPYFMGVIIDAGANIPATEWLMNAYQITEVQAAMRISLVAVAVFPLGSLACQVGMKKLAKRSLED